MSWHLRPFVAVYAVASASSSQAIVAFSNFGPGYAYDVQGGWTVSGPTSGFPTQVLAFQFVAEASGPLSSVRIAFGNYGGTNIGKVILYDDSGSNTLGDELISWTQSLPHFGEPDLITLENPGQAPVLTAGAKYWVGTHYVAADTWDVWNMTTVTDARMAAFSYNGGDTYEYSMQLPAGAFEVNVVPEPSTVAALAVGLGLAARARSRRKRIGRRSAGIAYVLYVNDASTRAWTATARCRSEEGAFAASVPVLPDGARLRSRGHDR